jgi:hypothetical protein
LCESIRASLIFIKKYVIIYIESKEKVNFMKDFIISAYENGVKKTKEVKAKDRNEALRLAWELFDCDDVYVTEKKGDI